MMVRKHPRFSAETMRGTPVGGKEQNGQKFHHRQDSDAERGGRDISGRRIMRSALIADQSTALRLRRTPGLIALFRDIKRLISWFISYGNSGSNDDSAQLHS